MPYEITEPQKGRVVLDLNWKDAEILCRLVGLANTGNLHSVSPVLAEYVEDMVKVVGRNVSTEAQTYTAKVERWGQVYVSDLR